MQQKSIKKNVIMNSILTVSNFVFPILTYSYVARVLTPTGTGKVAFTESVVAYFLYIASLGIPPYGEREAAKVREDETALSKLVQELFYINMGAAVVAYALLWIVVLAVPKLHEYVLLILIMGGQIVLKMVGFEWFYEGIEEYSYIAIRSLIFKIISVILTFALIKSRDDAAWYAFVHVFTISASYVCNCFHIRKYVSFKKTGNYEFKRHFKPILVLFSASIAIQIYAHFDVSMLGFISTEYEVGLYNAAFKIRNIVLAISTAITTVLVPRVAYYFEKKEEEKIIDLLTKSTRASLLISIPVAVYVFVNSESVLSFIGGAEYVGTATTLRVLISCVIALIINNMCGIQLLIPMGKEKRYSQSVIVGLFINLFLNSLLIPKMGALGAAIGTLATEMWNVIWLGTSCSDYLKKIFSNITFLRYIIPMGVSGIACFYIRDHVIGMQVFWQLVLASVVFFGIYYVSMLMVKEPLFCDLLSKVNQKIMQRKE